MSEERKHHPYGPSKLQALEACPCYENQSDVVHIAATTGTLQHAVAETGIDNEELSDSQVAAAAECMEFVKRQRQLLIDERNRHYPAAVPYDTGFPGIIELEEIYLPIDDVIIEVPNGAFTDAYLGTTGGYVDKLMIAHHGFRAILVDYKFGKWRVENAENNLQGIAYALGAFKMFPRVETVDFYFKQPALDSISHATFKRSDIDRLLLRVKTVVRRAVEAAKSKDFRYTNPTVPGCLFCAAIGRCPKIAEFSLRVSEKFSPVELPADVTPTGVISDPKLGSQRLKLAQVMETWAGAVRKLETDRVLRGDVQPPEGYEITSASKRKIIDSAKLKHVVLSYLTDAEFESTIDIGLTKVEKLISAKSPRGQKEATVEAFQEATVQAGAIVQGQPYAFLKAKSS